MTKHLVFCIAQQLLKKASQTSPEEATIMRSICSCLRVVKMSRMFCYVKSVTSQWHREHMQTDSRSAVHVIYEHVGIQ